MTTEVGGKLEGKVTGITNFGAFVQLPDGKTGLVHISEVDDQYVKDIREVLSVGDVVTVKVLNIGEDGKIGLSIKKAKERRRPGRGKTRHDRKRDLSFEDKLNRFLKDSEENLASLRRHTESKRGGRRNRRGF